MRILVATPYLFPHGGGLERYAHTLAQRLVAQGHRVVELGHGPVASDHDEGGLRQVTLPPRWKLSNTPVTLGYHGLARRLVREERIDVVSVHTPVPGCAELAALAAKRERVPYVVTYHAGRLEAPRGSALNLAAAAHRGSAERLLLRGAAGRIAVSRYVADHVFRGRASAVIPPGVDAQRFRPALPEAPGRILYVGPVDRAYAWKGFATLAEAFVRVAAANPRAHLRVVGQGDLVDEHRARFAAAGLAERVSFAGRVAEADLPEEYQRASVVVLPSTSPAESFGMVLAEANACGKPVVGSRVGGIPCFVDDGVNGLLAKPGDPAVLAAKIERLLADERLRKRLGMEGRAKVLNEHRWDALAKETAAVLQAAAHRGASRATAASARAPRRTSP